MVPFRSTLLCALVGSVAIPFISGAESGAEVAAEPGAEPGADHWAWRPPTRPPFPALEGEEVSEHPIDRFVQAVLEREGLAFSPRAERARLLRRVSFDLTGLPPTPAALDAFLSDEAPGAWERAVDRLLASPRFGERWASWWLDLARYADTQGYEKDNRRSIWRYRDWVIDAFNIDLPFDRFSVMQLAGDLSPAPTTDDRVATAFHRNTMTNDEGGTNDEEFRVAAVVDRVNTTMEVWMGLTMGCAQCHEHKYDPFEQREFYELFAFFNQTADDDHADDRPVLRGRTAREASDRTAAEARLADLDARFEADDPDLDRAQREWEESVLVALEPYERMAPKWSEWFHAGPFTGTSYEDALERSFGPEASVADGVDLEATWADGSIAWTRRPEWKDGPVHEALTGTHAANYLFRRVTTRTAGEIVLSLGTDDGFELWVNGESVLARREERSAEPDADRISVELRAGENDVLLKVVNSAGPSAFAFRALPLDLPGALPNLLRIPRERRPAAQARFLRRWFRANVVTEIATLADDYNAARKALEELIEEPPVPVMVELEGEHRRATHLLARGNYLFPEQEVSPAVPALFSGLAPGDPPDRLGFARWLVGPQNPLTARVIVNRLWGEVFGAGIVRTPEDFGTRGDLPTHPELLDWLAVEFRERGWSVKQLLRLFVTSETYRQASSASAELLAADPLNRWLARGSRFRLNAEMVRDQALAVAGLLSERMYGPPVFPHQPDGVWNVIYSDDRWRLSPGEQRHRRGMYTFWRRTSPYPSAILFDAPSREYCVSRRQRSNTPLQALVTLNDPVFVETARALARRALAEGGADDTSRIEWVIHCALARPPRPQETARLARLLADERAHFAEAPAAALDVVGDDAPTAATAADGADAAVPEELAAWTMLTTVLLNLDELLTKG